MTSCELRQPTRAITPPTERSIPAVRIMTVIPTATTTRIVDCLSTLMMFFRVKKFSFRNERAMHRASSPRGRSRRTDDSASGDAFSIFRRRVADSAAGLISAALLRPGQSSNRNVEDDGAEHHCPDQGELIHVRHARYVQSIAQNGNQDDSKDRIGDAALAFFERGSANDGGGNGIEVPAQSRA